MVKITRPVKHDTYLRQRLFDQLDKMRKNPVIWISAPAGAGKTTLVSSFIGNSKLPCLWYQCDKDDGDPATFFYYMGLAAAKASPGKRKPMALFTPEYQHGLETFTRNYFQQLYLRLKKPSLLILDNYQDVADTPEFLKIIKTAFAHVPDGVNIIVISRHDPPDALIRLQANDIMDILRWPDIRLTEEEARGVIQSREKTPASEEIFEDIYKISEGWAAGLVLMAASLKNKKSKTAFTGKQSHAEIIAYFGQEIFNHLDTKTQNFFMRTAFLPQMTAEMAAQITKEQSAGDILWTMNKNNYFISKHGHAEAIYEYHPLYQEFLQSQARKLLPADQLQEIHIKSATLLEQNGQTEAAIAVLREAAQYRAMADIIIIHAPDMLNEGRHRLLKEWLDGLPPDITKKNPWLLYFRAMSIMPFNPPETQSLFEEVFDKFQKQQDQFGAMLSACGVINAIFLSYEDFHPLDHWRAVLNDLAQNINEFPDKQIEAWVTGCLVIASSWREIYLPETELWEKRAFTIAETTATASIKAQALYLVYWHQLFYKGIPEALPVLNDLWRLADNYENQPLVTACALLAEVQYHLCTGLHDKVMEVAAKGLAIAEKSGVHVVDVWYYIFIIMSYSNRMDYSGAQPWIDQIKKDVGSWPKWAKSSYHWIMTQVGIFKNNYPQALHEGESGLDLSIKSGNPFSIASAHLSLANLFCLMGKHDAAIEHLKQGRSYAVQRKSKVTMIIALLYDAAFNFADGNEQKGRSLLGQCFALARESEVALHLSYNPITALRMCEKALEEGIETEYVQHIIRRRNLFTQKSPVHIENWPWPVKIYTMGRFAILVDGEPLQKHRKAKQTPIKLLQAIIALGGRDVSCEKLSDLLWPDAEGDIAHHALETTLQRLRKLLEYPEAVYLNGGKLTLDNRYCWVDSWAFERLLGQADHSKAAEDDESRKKDLLEKAMNLYKGDFLSGEKEESWTISPAEHLKIRYFKSAWWLISYLEKNNQLDKAAQYCENLLSLDECREDIYRKLMLIHNNMGNKSEALHAYQRCRKTLSSQLGISPSAETQALHNEIMAANFKTAK